MDLKKITIQALVAVVLFTIVSVVLARDYSEEVWIEKGLRGLIFGVIYFVFLIVKEKFKKNKEENEV
ncbi:MAG: hypothetical protein AB8B59_12895 [Maribacter sp.]